MKKTKALTETNIIAFPIIIKCKYDKMLDKNNPNYVNYLYKPINKVPNIAFKWIRSVKLICDDNGKMVYSLDGKLPLIYNVLKEYRYEFKEGFDDVIEIAKKFYVDMFLKPKLNLSLGYIDTELLVIDEKSDRYRLLQKARELISENMPLIDVTLVKITKMIYTIKLNSIAIGVLELFFQNDFMSQFEYQRIKRAMLHLTTEQSEKFKKDVDTMLKDMLDYIGIDIEEKQKENREYMKNYQKNYKKKKKEEKNNDNDN